MASQVFHAPLVRAQQRLALTCVLERHGQRSRLRYHYVQIVRSMEELLAHDVELIIIATPNASHYELAAQALESGRHVVVDKPFTLSSAEAGELIAMAEGAGTVLTVFHNRRWDGDFLTLRKLLEEQRLGRVVEFESHFDRYRPQLRAGVWRESQEPGAGSLWDLGPHLLDQAVVLFGTPQAVTAQVGRQRQGAQADDSFTILLHYAGLTATLKAGMLVREPGPRFTVHGTLGSYVKHGLDPQEEALKNGRSPQERDWGREPEDRWGILNSERNGHGVRQRYPTLPGRYQDFYTNVCDAISKGTPPPVRAEEAQTVVRLIELAYQSSQERRTVELD